MASIFELEQPSFGRKSEGKLLVAASNSANTTLTAPQAVGSIVTCTPTSAISLVTPAATAIFNELGAQAKAGQTFTLNMVNLATSAQSFTLEGGTGVTVTGAPAVSAGSSGTFVGRVASATAVTFYRA